MTVLEKSPNRMTRTVEEAAPLLGVGRASVYKLAKSGELHSVRVGRKLLIPLAAIDAFLRGETINEGK